MNKDVTLVITSCNRIDLLEKTISSLEEYNTHNFKESIIIDDSGDENCKILLEKLYGDRYKLLFNFPPLGQIASIDKVYSYVKTPFIFHCEDDWRFLKKGFVESSLDILESDKSILQVHIRSHNDLNGHPIMEDSLRLVKGHKIADLSFDYMGTWNGFSFNPGLKRIEDYDLLVNGYCSVGHEACVSRKYKELGFKACVFLDKYYVEHIGWGRHIDDKISSKLIKR